MSWSASGNQTFSRSFSYESLNRISSMTETSGVVETCKPASSASSPYTVAWTIDPWGNLTAQTPNSVQQPNNNPVCSISQSARSNNQLSGYSYDAAGNMTSDGSNFYFYDAENRLSEVYPLSFGNLGTTPPSCGDYTTVTCYYYDANGWRISKYAQGGAQTTFYVYNTDGQVVADTDGNQNWNESYLHFGSQLVANYRGGWTGFFLKDHLGSTRLDTVFVPTGKTPPSNCIVPSGTTFCVYDNYDYLPFGQQIAGNNATPYKFTGKERDPESGLDNFGARYNSSSIGRFMSPDPAGVLAAKPLFPQSWNLYSYVQNSPLNLIDPDGLDCVYLNNDGSAVEFVDHNTNSKECHDHGGAYASGWIRKDDVYLSQTTDEVLVLQEEPKDLFNLVKGQQYHFTLTFPGDMGAATGGLEGDLTLDSFSGSSSLGSPGMLGAGTLASSLQLGGPFKIQGYGTCEQNYNAASDQAVQDAVWPSAGIATVGALVEKAVTRETLATLAVAVFANDLPKSLTQISNATASYIGCRAKQNARVGEN